MSLTISKRGTFETKVRKAGNRTLTFTISTETKALDGGLLIADGANMKQFSRNPVILWSHKADMPAIGRGRELRRVKNGWELDIEFAPADVNPFADQIYRLIEWAGHGATSVGFIVDKHRPPTPEERETYGMTDGWAWVGEAWTLLETSIVNVPSDLDALQKDGHGMQVARSAAVWARAAACKVTDTMAEDEENAAPREEQSDAATPSESGDAMEQVMAAMTAMAATLAEIKNAVMAMNEGEPREAADEEVPPKPAKDGEEEEDDEEMMSKFFEAIDTIEVKGHKR